MHDQRPDRVPGYRHILNQYVLRVSATQVRATIAASDITTAGTAQVTVFTPAPGGGTSNAQTFTIASVSTTGLVASYSFNAGSGTTVADASVHLAATYDGATQRLYVNGVQVSSRAQTGAMTTSASPLRIGGNGVWGEFFQGRIDEVRMYNRALSPAEIQTDMNTPVTP